MKQAVRVLIILLFYLIHACDAGYGDDTKLGFVPCSTPDLFVNKVWLSIESNCVICHQPGVIGSKLIFNSLETVDYNYNVLRAYTIVDANKLRGKSVGQYNHGGQAPFTDPNSREYKDLDELIPLMLKECV